MSYKAIFALCAIQDWDYDYMDVKTDFFYRLEEEVIYIAQLLEYSNGSAQMCKLWKALYGLKQLSQIWYQTLAKFFNKLRFWPFCFDLSVFTKVDVIIAIYMDDLHIYGIEKKKNWQYQRSSKSKISYVWPQTNLILYGNSCDPRLYK